MMGNKTLTALGLGAMLLTCGIARAQDVDADVEVTAPGATVTGQAGMSTSSSTSGSVQMRSGMSTSVQSSQIIERRRVYRTVRTYRMVPVYRSGRVVSHRRVYYSRRMYRTVPVYRSGYRSTGYHSSSGSRRARSYANTGE